MQFRKGNLKTGLRKWILCDVAEIFPKHPDLRPISPIRPIGPIRTIKRWNT